MKLRTGGLALVGILLLALNLRPAAVSVGPVLTDLRTDLAMSPTTTGLLTSLPVLAFAGFGALAPTLARLVGAHRVTLLALLAVVAGLCGRSLAEGPVAFLALSMLALAGMAMANVLLPSLVKLHFPDRVGRVTALYTTALSVGLTLALLLTVPVSDLGGGWRVGLAVWGVLALLAASPWLALVRHDTTAVEAQVPVGFWEVLRTPLGAAMAFFFGLQSMQAYVVFGWFPTLWRDAGYSPVAAGALVGLVAATSIPLSLWAPAALARSRRPERVMLAVMAAYPLGYLGLLIEPRTLAVPAAVLVGAGMTTFPLVLVLIGLRARTAAGTAALSSVTQSVGYLLAGVGPFAVGLLHERTGGWTWPLLVLLALGVPQVLVGVYAARSVPVEDQLPRTIDPA